MNNIDAFNLACANIFVDLYESFPISKDIDPVSTGYIAPSDGRNEPREIFSETMIFLADEGYIKYDRNTDKYSSKSGVRLTSKGLDKLQKTPAGIQIDSKSFIEQLRDTLNSVGGQVSTTVTSEAVKQILKMFFSS